MVPDPTPDSIIQHLLDRFEGTRVVAAWGRGPSSTIPAANCSAGSIFQRSRKRTVKTTRPRIWIAQGCSG